MQIRRTNSAIVMSSTLVCKDYGNSTHAIEKEFEKIGDNTYKCKDCSSIMIFKEPVLILDDNGRLKIEVIAELK